MKNDNHDSDFIEKCKDIDFSAESVNKEKNLEILKTKLRDIDNERENNMSKKIKIPVAFVAAAAALMCLSAAIYGQDLVRIIKTVTLGNYAEYYVVEDDREFIPIPEEIRGQVFDKDGNELQVFPDDRIIYDENGKEVRPVYDNGTVRIMTDEEFDSVHGANSSKWFTTYDLEEGKSYFICDTLSPGYLPDGYVFDRIEFYGDPTNPADIEQDVQKYMSVYYSNGIYEMYSQVRFMDERTAYGGSATENVRQAKINGHNAVIDKNTVDIQIGDVMYMFFATEDTTIDDLIKMAESLE